MYGNRVRRLTPKWVDEAVRTRYGALQEPIRAATKQVELLAQEAIEGFESAVRVFEVLRAAVCFYELNYLFADCETLNQQLPDLC